MTLYLDQNKIIDLAHDSNLLNELIKILKRKNIKVAISFSHVHETAKATNSVKIIKTVEQMPYIQLTALIRILDCEVRNEFYKFLKLDKRDLISILGNIFVENQGNNKFRGLVSQTIRNTSQTNAIRIQNDHYEGVVRKALANKKRTTPTQLMSDERKALINNYINKHLTPKYISEHIGLYLAPKSLDAQEFVRNFNFSNCPYLSFYTEFQARRYMDKLRDPKGDLPDIEHAVHGALSCGVLVIERNAAEIIKQIVKAGSTIKAKVFTDLKEAMRYLKKT